MFDSKSTDFIDLLNEESKHFSNMKLCLRKLNDFEIVSLFSVVKRTSLFMMTFEHTIEFSSLAPRC